jgi:hypothetical protein
MRLQERNVPIWCSLALQCILEGHFLLRASNAEARSNASNRPWELSFITNRQRRNEGTFSAPLGHGRVGVVIVLIQAILKKYWECVLQFLKQELGGLAARRLEERLRLALALHIGRNGQQSAMYMHMFKILHK